MIYLLKPGELSLKKGNKPVFEKLLSRNLAILLRKTLSGAQISNREGRFYVRVNIDSADTKIKDIESALDHLAGISGWARTSETDKTEAAVIAACVEEARRCLKNGARSFKLEARRTDKSFLLSSYELNCAAGNAITAAFPDFKVDVHKPDVIIRIEIRERAFVYGSEKKGLGGLPVGSGGRGMLLLSGGIDSPVAGFLMLLRGLRLNAVYFHAYPYTSDEAKQKVISLAALLRCYGINLKLFVLSFTATQKLIKEKSPKSWSTVLLRMAMMEAASLLARREKCRCLVTGESLSQVASQTIENIACSESQAALPVLRPLIGMDKEAITKKAIEIGTYPISILPYTDCCALFSPEHPVLRGKPDEAARLYSNLELSSLILTALKEAEVYKE